MNPLMAHVSASFVSDAWQAAREVAEARSELFDKLGKKHGVNTYKRIALHARTRAIVAYDRAYDVAIKGGAA